MHLEKWKSAFRMTTITFSSAQRQLAESKETIVMNERASICLLPHFGALPSHLFLYTNLLNRICHARNRFYLFVVILYLTFSNAAAQIVDSSKYLLSSSVAAKPVMPNFPAATGKWMVTNLL